MMLKKGIMSLALIVFLSSLILAASADDYKIGIYPDKDVFSAGNNITLRINLLDSENNPISENLEMTLENTNTGKELKYTIPTNQHASINLGEGANSGYWIITIQYNEEETKALFEVETEELVELSLNGETLAVKNIGNTKYSKTIQIIIGDTISTRTPNLDVDEEIEYRLVAPKGSYNIKVTDGVTTVTENQVSLTGTGQAIGAIDERSSQRSPLTGGIAPEEEDDIAILSFMKQGQLVYIFMLVVIGAFILLAIERHYSKKKSK